MKQNWIKGMLVALSLIVIAVLSVTGCERVGGDKETQKVVKEIKGSEKIEINNSTPHLIGTLQTIHEGNIMYSAKGQSGALVYGPYWPLKKGNYRVKFNLMLTGKPEQLIAHIDVNAFDNATQNSASEPIKKKLYGTDKPKWQEHFIDFTVVKNEDGNLLYEFRVFPTGAGDVRVREIILEKM